ncbi:hypothetical protein [Geodermatophilus marinus]|uniref:hypothetical protein n=1 Tax=Geodermatophilus sp. LHW52908 TaxID=2303986 RepID=UPI000E3B7F08|nr:hypothetical protein [Geodermatophilus sp. LHW52908]RFU21295.1 hypothetical protein D0Z06_10935 [Geodermatophilus sp. LHW52908]
MSWGWWLLGLWPLVAVGLALLIGRTVRLADRRRPRPDDLGPLLGGDDPSEEVPRPRPPG